MFDARPILANLLAGCPLGEARAEELFQAVLSGHLDDAQIAAALALVQARGVTIDELVGAARVMRRHVTPVAVDHADVLARGAVVVDTCGTGGTPKTFNVSTAAAIVAAAAAPGRVLVAKHGNRSRSGRGSAEVLAALGVNVDAPPAVQARCLREIGVCFCFAIHHHPAMKHAAGPRRSLGFPTIFNLLGPLTNPAGASCQVLGVSDARFVPLMAAALGRLGARRALVVHGMDGMDELSTAAPTLVAPVGLAGVPSPLDPRALGLDVATRASLEARDLDDAARIFRSVLSGEAGPHRDIVLLNAAAALLVGEAAADLHAGLALAARAIDSGRAAATLDALARASHAPA